MMLSQEARLQEENAALHAQLAALTATMEARVLHRTEALLETISELETLSYTISHDLRAPLRAIDGYAQMVLEDEPTLGAEARRHLGEVRGGAQRMARLIDGLLAYSRLSRVEPQAERVNLHDLAHDVVAQMEGAGTLGRARVDIGPLPAAHGDRQLLRQLLEHLLANAVKFSANAEMPRVELGGREEGGRAVVLVKDNGAGFDMRYKDKLFGVFQRLHHPADFDGAGVGLAMARRIVERHGGSIWAEGAPGEGAMFTFSVPAAGE